MGKDQAGWVSAAEITCYAYCPEQWRLEYGLGVEPENRAVIAAGEKHHRRKARVERMAGGSIWLGVLLIGGAFAMLLWWIWR